MEIMRPRVSSATATALAPGVFMTTMPRRVASAASMLSTPTPARPMMRSLGAAASRVASAWTAERTIRASASASSAGRPPGAIWSAVTTFQPCSFWRIASVAGETFSARTIFNDGSSMVLARLCATFLVYLSEFVSTTLLRGRCKACDRYLCRLGGSRWVPPSPHPYLSYILRKPRKQSG